MNKVLAKFLWLFILVYIDDIIVYSLLFKSHLQHLDSMLKMIANANIMLSPPKCHIGYQSLILLGQCISRLGISTHQEKIDTIDAMKLPAKVKDLQMFLGFMNYFANYIPFFTWLMRPLYQLLHKDTKWEWNASHQESYELCKLVLKSAPILGYPKDRLGYRLYTDTSNFGIGAILQQIQSIKIKVLQGTQLYNQLEKAHKSSDLLPQLVAIANKDKIRPIIVMNWVWVISPGHLMKERDLSAHRQILLLLGTCLCTGRSYYSGTLVCSLTELGSPRGNGVTDDLGSCWSYSPCHCLTVCPICLGGSVL